MKDQEKGSVRVLGVDTSIRSSGVAVVEARGNLLAAVEYRAISTSQKHPVSECLGRLHRGIADLISRTSPHAAAIEGGFYCRNAKTAMLLGEARGVVIAVCNLSGIPVFEYSPRRVKQALVGYGAAEKEQVRRMVMAILRLDGEPDEDSGDALAIAITHLHSRTEHAALAPEPI